MKTPSSVGSADARREIPKGRLKKGDGGRFQSSLRDSNRINGYPGVETPGYSRDVPSGRRPSNRSQERGQQCPRERRPPNSRTQLFALLLIVAALTVSSLLLCPASAHAQGGVPLWTNRYDAGTDGLQPKGASTVAVDRSGNVFVTGTSYNGPNAYIMTVKYSSSVPPPHLDFQLLNSRLVLSWADDGFNLQTAPAITGPFSNLPGASSPYTNAVTFAQQFFRLGGN